MANKRAVLPIAMVLGLLALLPFAAGVYHAYTGTALDARMSLRWLLPYLATIVAFTGGVQWGRMLSQTRVAPPGLVLATTPSLIAWAALLSASPWRGLLLLLALVIAWLIDEHGVRCGWQTRGFLQLRRLLSLLMGACIVAIGWRVIRG